MATLLKTEPRHAVGTRSSRNLRAQGRIPVTLQAEGQKPHFNLSIDEDAFMLSRRKHEHVYELDLENRREPALVRELHWDTFGEKILHIEFRRVDLTKKTRVEVELEFTGHPKGVLNHLITRVPVMALPTAIPDFIEVSVADMEVGRTVLASELKLPEGVELAAPPDLPVARISQIKIEVAPTPVLTPEQEAAAAAAAAAATVAEGAAAAPAKGEAPKKAGAEPGKKSEGPRKEKG